MTYSPQHQPPHYVVQMQRPQSNGPAVTAMVLGIVAAAVGVWALIPILGLISAILAFLPAVVAVILGHLGLRGAHRMGGVGRSQAIAGLTLGYITLGIIIATTLFWIIAMTYGSATTS